MESADATMPSSSWSMSSGVTNGDIAFCDTLILTPLHGASAAIPCAVARAITRYRVSISDSRHSVIPRFVSIIY